MHIIRCLLAALILAASPVATSPVAANPVAIAETGPASAIQGVIERQLDAFQRSDEAAAFQYAAPNIQGIFMNPGTFGEMVRRGYPMVWRPRSYQMGDLEPFGDGWQQTVLFEALDGRFYEADYEMLLIDGQWRIGGVRLRQVEGFGV